MSSERRTFRPFDIPVALERFLDDARLLVGDEEDIYVEPSSRRVVSDAELRSGAFSLSLARDSTAFDQLLEQARGAVSGQYPDGAIGLVVVAISSYLKLAEIVLRRQLGEVERVMRLTDGVAVRPFRSVFHGCDVEASLVLLSELEEETLRPWRKGTWMSRARFELRTGLDGAGFNVLPLTDELRGSFGLPKKTLRFIDLTDSPLELDSSHAVNLYVDADLLARLNREMSKPWAISFADQLAVDVLAGIALRAAADPSIHDAEWSVVAETLLGALIAMVDGNTGGDEAEAARRRQEHLDELRNRPNRFLALIEGAMEMRDNTKRIVGG